MATPVPSAEMLDAFSQCAYRLGMAFGAEAERTQGKAMLEACERFERCFFSVRMAIGLQLRLRQPMPVQRAAESERERAERIAAGCDGLVPPFLTVAETAAVLGQARQIVGLDTGFSHLAAAFGAPTIGIYCDHEPGLAGITGPGPVASLGGKGQMPALAEVMAALELQLGASAG